METRPTANVSPDSPEYSQVPAAVSSPDTAVQFSPTREQHHTYDNTFISGLVYDNDDLDENLDDNIFSQSTQPNEFEKAAYQLATAANDASCSTLENEPLLWDPVSNMFVEKNPESKSSPVSHWQGDSYTAGATSRSRHEAKGSDLQRQWESSEFSRKYTTENLSRNMSEDTGAAFPRDGCPHGGQRHAERVRRSDACYEDSIRISTNDIPAYNQYGDSLAGCYGITSAGASSRRNKLPKLWSEFDENEARRKRLMADRNKVNNDVQTNQNLAQPNNDEPIRHHGQIQDKYIHNSRANVARYTDSKIPQTLHCHRVPQSLTTTRDLMTSTKHHNDVRSTQHPSYQNLDSRHTVMQSPTRLPGVAPVTPLIRRPVQALSLGCEGGEGDQAATVTGKTHWGQAQNSRSGQGYERDRNRSRDPEQHDRAATDPQSGGYTCTGRRTS